MDKEREKLNRHVERLAREGRNRAHRIVKVDLSDSGAVASLSHEDFARLVHSNPGESLRHPHVVERMDSRQFEYCFASCPYLACTFPHCVKRATRGMVMDAVVSHIDLVDRQYVVDALDDHDLDRLLVKDFGACVGSEPFVRRLSDARIDEIAQKIPLSCLFSPALMDRLDDDDLFSIAKSFPREALGIEAVLRRLGKKRVLLLMMHDR